MSAKRITRTNVKNFSRLKKGRTDWARVRSANDASLDFSDIPDISDEEIARSRWTAPRAGVKVTVSMRIDPDLLDWFRRSGRGYQSRIHAVLRAFQRSRLDKKPKKSARRAA